MTRIWTHADAYAIFSPCRRYRYTLHRHLQPHLPGPCCAFIGLNPSTADEFTDDPTVRRCWRFAERWGYARFCMLNLFAWRDTDPTGMKLVEDPVGPANNVAIFETCRQVDLIVFAWGVHGTHLNRSDGIVASLPHHVRRKVRCLGKTKDGHPKHPLYLRNDADLVPFYED